MRNKFTVFSKDYQDYFDFLEIVIHLPEIRAGKFGITSDNYTEPREFKDGSAFIIDARSVILYKSVRTKKVFIFKIFGLGFSVTRQFGY